MPIPVPKRKRQVIQPSIAEVHSHVPDAQGVSELVHRIEKRCAIEYKERHADGKGDGKRKTEIQDGRIEPRLAPARRRRIPDIQDMTDQHRHAEQDGVVLGGCGQSAHKTGGQELSAASGAVCVNQEHDGHPDQTGHDHVGRAEVRAAHVHRGKCEKQCRYDPRRIVAHLTAQPEDDQHAQRAGESGNHARNQEERLPVDRPAGEHRAHRLKRASSGAP
jgi:hypothetical protein